MQRRDFVAMALASMAAGCRADQANSMFGASGAGTSTESGKTTTASAKPIPTQAIKPPKGAKNVVVINIDNLDLRELTFTGKGQKALLKYMPTLSALAAESLVFRNYHTTTPLCVPSRYALLTGNYASRATNQVFKDRLAREGQAVVEMNTLITQQEMTLPKRLKQIGYRTGFCGKDGVTERAGYKFAPYGGSVSSPSVRAALKKDQAYMESILQGIGFDEASGIYMNNPGELMTPELMVHNLDWIADGAVKFIANNAARTFFLYVAPTMIHPPLEPAKSWNAHPLATPFGYLDAAPTVMPPRSSLTPRVNAAGFPGAENWLWLDDAIAAVIKALKDQGLYEDTVIFVISDQGQDAPGAPHNRGTHSVGLVRYPGAVGTTNALLANIDLQPTILEIAQNQAVGDGVSMMPVILNPTAEVRPHLYTETGYARKVRMGTQEYVALRHSNYIRALAMANGWPLTPWVNDKGVQALDAYCAKLIPDYSGRDQFYNLATDPSQLKNLYADPAYQTTIAQFAQIMQSYANKLPGAFPV